MPPRPAPANPPTMANAANQLTPAQMAALQEHLRQRQAQTGGEVTAQMVQDWMVHNRGQLQQQQLAAAAQQQAAPVPTPQQPKPAQGPTLDQIIAHLFPQSLSQNPTGAAQHLQSILFPANAPQGNQSPLLQQVMLLASNGRLSTEQMNHLKNAVAFHQHLARGQQQQQQQQQAQAAQLAAAQQQQQQQQQHTLPQPHPVAQPPPPQPPVAPTPQPQQQQNPLQVLQTRIAALETLLQRPDLTEDGRQKAQEELVASKSRISQLVKSYLAQQQNAAGIRASPALQAAATLPAAAQAQAQGRSPQTSVDSVNAASEAGKKVGTPQSQQAPAAATPSSSAAPSSTYLPLGSATSAPQIPQTLTIPAAKAETFPPPRPTLSSGLANSPVVSTPALTTLGNSGAGVKKEDGAAIMSDPRPDSVGRTVRKRKIRELVEQVDPQERLSDEVEDLLLEIADEFIENITRFGCQLARHRKSDRLEVRDLALHLDRSWGIKIPGFSAEETRVNVRRVVVPPSYAGRVAAVKEASRRR